MVTFAFPQASDLRQCAAWAGIAAAALTLLTSPATATTPTISGKYAVNYTQTCQAVLANANSGSTSTQIAIADFDSSTGAVKVTGIAVAGDLVVWAGGTAGMVQNNISGTSTYANTATTLTTTGSTFSVVYGPVVKGIAQSFQFGGLTQSGCAAAATAIRQ